MTAGDDPPTSPKPPLIRPSQAWLAEQADQRAAYTERRRRHTEAWFCRIQGLADEPDLPEQAPDAGPVAPVDSLPWNGK